MERDKKLRIAPPPSGRVDTTHLKNCYCKRAVLPRNDNNLTRSGEKEEVASSPFTLHTSLKHKAAFTLAEGATHVAHSNNTRRAAFTLAEVLITLGIIGVVAAMTIPTIISKYKKHLVETKLKQTYSILSNALLTAMNENGPLTQDAYNNQYEYFFKYLKPVKHCTTSDPQTGLCKRNPINYKFPYDFYILPNGTRVAWNKGYSLWDRENYYGSFYIDLMVTKNPDKGTPKVDQFAFVLPNDINEKKLPDKNIFVSYNQGLSDSGAWTCFLLSSSNTNSTYNRKAAIKNCDGVGGDDKSASIHYGDPLHQCTALIVCNGFKIPEDYPYKF